MSKRINFRLSDGLYEDLERKAEILGVDKADFIRLLIRKFDIKMDVDKLRAIDVVGLTEAEKAKKFMKEDKVRYEEAMWEYKMKYSGEGGIMINAKEVNKIYVKNKLREELEAIGGKEYLTKILKDE